MTIDHRVTCVGFGSKLDARLVNPRCGREALSSRTLRAGPSGSGRPIRGAGLPYRAAAASRALPTVTPHIAEVEYKRQYIAPDMPTVIDVQSHGD